MALVVGTIIGSGVFLVAADIARAVHGAGAMLAVWITGEFFTLLGAMSLAELGAAIPDAGGIYTFIARAFGPLAGFLCGWMLFTVGTSGSIATLAAALPIYIGGFLTLTPTAAKAVGIGAITFFTAVNLVGVRYGARVQNALTVLKVGGLLAMVAAIFLLPSPARPAADALPGAVGPAALARRSWPCSGRTRGGTTSASRRARCAIPSAIPARRDRRRGDRRRPISPPTSPICTS